MLLLCGAVQKMDSFKVLNFKKVQNFKGIHFFIFFQRKSKKVQHRIIKSVRDVNNISNEVNALSGYIGINQQQNIFNTFFWYGEVKDIIIYVSEPLFDKTAKPVALFLYKQMCRHGVLKWRLTIRAVNL